MVSLRLSKKILLKGRKPIEFQVNDWSVVDEPIVNDEDEDEDEKTKYKQNVFNIKAFGCTKKGSSIIVNITGFEPHFYIKIPDRFEKTECDVLIKLIKVNLPLFHRKSIVRYKIVKKINFWGFSNKQKHKFIELYFSNFSAMKKTEKVLKKEIQFPQMKPQVFQVFESNIPPLFRFFHVKNIKPSGWIRIKNYVVKSTCNVNSQFIIETNWNEVNLPVNEKLDMAPFIIASYDIECDSSHGDFPLAEKDYLKLGQETVDKYYSQNLQNKNIGELSEILNKYIYDGFYQDKKEISILYTKQNTKPTKQSIKIVAQKASLVLKMVETYKILSADILSYILISDDLQSLIEDAFCDEDEHKDINVRKMFTKSNMKPTKKTMENVVKSIQNIINKFTEKYSDFDDFREILLNFNEYFVYSKDELSEFLKKQKITNNDLISKTFMCANQITSILNETFPELTVNKEIKVKRCNSVYSQYFPELEGDKVIQIGTAVQYYGQNEPFLKHIVTLGTCDDIEDTVVVQCKTEKEVLMEWSKFIVQLDPDIITGYNIFGFDYSYIFERARQLGIEEDFSKMSRLSKDAQSPLIQKKLASQALGDNTLNYIDMSGRINMDLLKVVQRDHRLESYKLDFVAETFMNDKIIEIISNDKLKIKNSKVLNEGNFITLLDGEGEKINEGQKFKIKSIEDDIIELCEKIDSKNIKKWCLAKDDVSPNDIFRLQKESSKGRAIIATYCIQDCVLVLHLINKLQIITNNIAMANTCSVPLGFIFLRGQGIKGLSLVSKECKEQGYLIPVLSKDKEFIENKNPKFTYSLDYEEKPLLDDSYEGAIVLDPKPGIYLDDYISVLDYSSLYPSSMISENLSHDSICLDPKYLEEDGAKLLKKLGYDYVDIEHDNYKWKDPRIKNKGKYKAGKKLCRYVQPPNGEKSIIPIILMKLLNARKVTRAKIKTEKDEFKQGVLDGQQLSYKITANSIYGLIGASTSDICMKDIAATTTRIGRSLLHLAKDKTEEEFEDAETIYGDTDSVFINFRPKNQDGTLMKGKEGLKKAIELGVKAEKYIQQFLKPPHKLEYEKTFWPFILFSKKRYLGNKYEFDVDNYKETSMGIVTKRRDNAKIVKYVYNHVKDSLLNTKNLQSSIDILNSDLNDLLNGKFKMNMLTITKNLRGFYANPEQVAHKVLADRMAERDPGNKPQSNDRIPYIYIETKEIKGKKILQGERVENPTYILENNLKPDYAFYITNQIMKPVGQIYSLIVETLPGFNKGNGYYKRRYKYYFNKYNKDEKKTIDKINDEKMADVEKLVFGDVLRKANNRKTKSREITDFFKKI